MIRFPTLGHDHVLFCLMPGTGVFNKAEEISSRLTSVVAL